MISKYAIDVTYDNDDVETFYANDIDEINKLLVVLLNKKNEIVKIEIFDLEKDN